MFAGKSNFAAGGYKRLAHDGSPNMFNYGGRVLSNTHHTCIKMLVKLAIVCLIVGGVQAVQQDSDTVNSLSSKHYANKQFTLYHHRQNPTIYKQRHTLHRTILNRNGQKSTKSGHVPSKMESGSDTNQNLKVDLENSSSKCTITVVSETNAPTINNCSSCSESGTNLHAMDRALNCMQNQNTNVELMLESDHLMLYEVHKFENHSGIHICS